MLLNMVMFKDTICDFGKMNINMTDKIEKKEATFAVPYNGEDNNDYVDDEGVQHIEYVPFGEVFVEERNNIWNTPYLFNAKEFDEETGLYYYGARYYDLRVSLWISTDPMEDRFPSVSSYTYVINNPLNILDPNGADIVYVNLGGQEVYRIKNKNRKWMH